MIRSDGTPERDYLYVDDAVDAYLAVAESLAEERYRGRAWNAGNDRPIAVRDVVARVIAAAGSDVEPEIRGEGKPPGEIDRQWLDSTAIREELGWQPRWELERGLAETYAWYVQHLV